MQGRTYEIKYMDDSLFYEPIQGIIRKRNSHETIKIYKDKRNQFPDYSHIAQNSLKDHFKPFCLTIYLNHKCNLNCPYCYVTDKEIPTSDEVDEFAIQNAAEMVSKSCVNKNMPFILGFHGGNEPLLNPSKIKLYMEICRKVTQEFGIELISVCTTNGVINKETAQWAAKSFYAITLSWDGPPDIQNRFRHHKDGSSTSSLVKRTANILSDRSFGLKQFRVRATITNESAPRLLEITKYFHQNNVRWVEFYPLYQNTMDSISPELIPQPELFVKNFILARNWGHRNRMNIGFAGSRINDFHDKYCPVYQHNLTITPDGYLTACFMATHNLQNQNNQYMYGQCNNEHPFEIDWSKLKGIYDQLGKLPLQCQNCFNSLHCAKGCPSICPLNPLINLSTGFDCRLLKWMGLANILTSAGYELSEKELSDCNSFFETISIKMLTKEVMCE